MQALMYKYHVVVVIADCEPNEHVNKILEYGASETVPDWTVTCGYRG